MEIYDKRFVLAEGGLMRGKFLAKHVIDRSGDIDLQAQAAGALHDIHNALVELTSPRPTSAAVAGEPEPSCSGELTVEPLSQNTFKLR